MISTYLWFLKYSVLYIEKYLFLCFLFNIRRRRISQKRETCHYSISDWKRIRDIKIEVTWRKVTFDASTFRNKYPYFLLHKCLSVHIFPLPRAQFSTRIISNGFPRAYARFIINALCSLVMALFYPKHQLFTRGERANARFSSFQRGFLFRTYVPWTGSSPDNNRAWVLLRQIRERIYAG